MARTKKEVLLPPTTERVWLALKRAGVVTKIKMLAAECRTSAEAAQVLGCHIGQIAKSLVFRTDETHRPVLVIASGVNHVDEMKVGEQVSERLEMADPVFVREKTGFAIGGVAPLGHPEPIKTFIDEDLFQYQEVWTAGGHPKTVFNITPQELARITGGKVIGVK